MWIWVTILKPIAKTGLLFRHRSRKSKFHNLCWCYLKSYHQHLHGRQALFWHTHGFVSVLHPAGLAQSWLQHDACHSFQWESHETWFWKFHLRLESQETWFCKFHLRLESHETWFCKFHLRLESNETCFFIFHLHQEYHEMWFCKFHLRLESNETSFFKFHLRLESHEMWFCNFGVWVSLHR